MAPYVLAFSAFCLLVVGMRWVRRRQMQRMMAATEGAWRETLQQLVIEGDRVDGDALGGVREGVAFRLRLEVGPDQEMWPTVVATVPPGPAATVWPKAETLKGGTLTPLAEDGDAEVFFREWRVDVGGGPSRLPWLDGVMRATLSGAALGVTLAEDGAMKVAILGALDRDSLEEATDVVRYVAARR